MVAGACGARSRTLRLAVGLASPAASVRTCVAYGGMYITVVLAWLHWVDGVTLTRWDVAAAAIALMGMTVIALQPLTTP